MNHKTLFKTYLSNVDKSTHEVLVAESGHSVLGLVPRRIFHNSAISPLASAAVESEMAYELTRIPTYTHGHKSQPVNPTIPSIARGKSPQKKKPAIDYV